MRLLEKKILIVKPEYRYFPIGIAYIISSLIKNNIDYEFMDASINPDLDIGAKLRRGDYGAVASGGLIGSFTFFKKLFKQVKEIDPNIPCILGGNITIDLNTKILFSNIPVDYLVIGEGEITFPELLKCLNDDGDLSKVDGLAFKENGGNEERIIKTKRRANLDIINENWMPVWNFFNIEHYQFNAMPILTGRGCVGRCSFCSPTNGRFRGRPIAHIMDEINWLSSKYKYDMNVFMNEVFFTKEDVIHEFCKEYKKITPFKHWNCLMRMDVNPEVLYVMHDTGCRTINVGVESGSNRVLENIKKDITVEQTRNFIQTAIKAGINIQASFMMANYDERAEEMKATIDLLTELGVKGPMALTINYPGTLNYYRALKRGLINDEIAYTESLDKVYGRNYYQVITGYRNRELDYLNLSALPTEEMFRVVEKEMRRYFTQNFRFKNVSLKEIKGPQDEQIMEVSAYCPFCNKEHVIQFNPSLLNPFDMMKNCICGAHMPLYLDPFSIESYRNYFSAASEALKQSSRIALVGSPDTIRLFLTYDLLKVNYDHIIGIVAHEQMPEGFALNHPILPIEKLAKLEPDLLIVVSTIPKILLYKLEKLKSRFLNKIIFLIQSSEFQSVNDRSVDGFAKLIYLDLKLYEHSSNRFFKINIVRTILKFLYKLKEVKEAKLSKKIKKLDEIYEKAIYQSDYPAVDDITIDLHEMFLGSGWGLAEQNIHGHKWRWLGPEGRSNLYLRLNNNQNYLLKSLIHAAKGDSQERFHVYINNKSAQKQRIITEEGQRVFHNCIIPKEAVNKNQGWVKITYKIEKPFGNSHEIVEKMQFEPMQFALSLVLVKPYL